MIMLVIEVTVVTLVTNVAIVHWLLWLHEGAGRASSYGRLPSSFNARYFVLEMVNMIGNVAEQNPSGSLVLLLLPMNSGNFGKHGAKVAIATM